jgi:hypothetical protein
MENFIEYCLSYKPTAKDRMMQMVSTVGPMVLGVGLIMYLGVLGIALCAGLCYLAYRWYLSYIYELEYTLLEDEISFSKIINKERRRDLFSASIAKTESYGPIENRPAVQCPVKSVVSHQGDLPEYFWITYDKKGNKICVLFQPTPAVLDVFSTRARGKLR